MACVSIIGIIAFLAIPSVSRMRSDSERNLAIARAESLNLAQASFIQVRGRTQAAAEWTAAASATARYNLLLPYLSLALLFRLTQALGVFDLVQVLTGGGPAGSTESLALYAYLNAMRFLDFGYSATVVMGTFVLLLLAVCLALLLWRRSQPHRRPA